MVTLNFIFGVQHIGKIVTTIFIILFVELFVSRFYLARIRIA